MKKLIFICFSIFVLTGCNSKKIICTGNEEQNGINSKIRVVAKFKNKKVNSINAEYTFDDEKTTKSYCSILELSNSFTKDDKSKIDFKCSKNKIIFNNYVALLEMNNKDLTIKNMTEEKFVAYMKEQNLSCK